MKRNLVVYCACLFLGLISPGCRENPILFAGGFTEGNDKGLSLFELNRGNGELNIISQTDGGPSPAFFCFSKRHKLIYSMNEVMQFNGTRGGGITTLKFDPERLVLEKKNEILVPAGGPCHISISADSNFLFVASYGSGSVAVVRLDPLGIPEMVTDTILYVTQAPIVSHPHMIAQDNAGKHVYLTDLGLDRIMIYDLDPKTGTLVPLPDGIVNLPIGSGPRHFIFSSDNSMMYVINELGSTVMVFRLNELGSLDPVQTISTVREGFTGNNACAEILAGRDGRFLYGSNRGENSIVVFKIGDDGLLSLAGHSSCGGDWPRNFVIDPSGKYLLSGNQRSGQISVFKINHKTGLPEGPVSNADIKAPAYLEFWK